MTLARRIAVLLAVSAGVYALGVRPRLLRSGASDEKGRQPYPGADLIPGGRRGATMAVTIDAPPSRVWPWLVQMGCDRAGWYSWDRLDNASARPRLLQLIANLLFWEPAHWVMQRRQLANLKRRAERQHPGPSEGAQGGRTREG